MKYLEFCAGMGGTRAGLDAAGWKCVFAVDNDPDAVEVHRLAHQSASLADITELSAGDLPDAEIWVAGFPCQPFSSSGNRLGFGHNSGNVFEHLARLVADHMPRVLFLENVQGLLTNKSGHTFATILIQLAALGYEVDWLVMDLRWFGVPQSRPRLFVVATRKGVLSTGQLDRVPGAAHNVQFSVFSDFLEVKRLSWSVRARGDVRSIEEVTRPAVGKPRYAGRHFFGPLGHVSGTEYVSFDLGVPKFHPAAEALAEIVAPDFSSKKDIRSARYWSPKGGGGPHGLHVRNEPLSHCVGTSLGGAPLFAVPKSSVRKSSQRRAFLRFANWHREQDGLLVMRLQPERAVLLFGPNTIALSDAISRWEAGATRKFKLVGNMVAPICAYEIAGIIQERMVRLDA